MFFHGTIVQGVRIKHRVRSSSFAQGPIPERAFQSSHSDVLAARVLLSELSNAVIVHCLSLTAVSADTHGIGRVGMVVSEPYLDILRLTSKAADICSPSESPIETPWAEDN